ncbi:MAG: ATP-binding cassette domain-containing protein, partial [Planctomycetota bacterium]
MSRKFIYQIENLTKKHGQRKVLEDVSLAFYPGAKIGVLGPNGAGKSTLMKIMAGKDTEFEGSARLSGGFTVGYLEQEPPLDETKTVAENVQDAVAERQAILDRVNEIYMTMGEVEGDAYCKLEKELEQLQNIVEAANLWELDRQVQVAMDVMNLPPGDSPVTNLSGGEKRRIALCQLLIR